MGCMTEALDGMEVTTLDRYSIELRKYVLEWLMMNHPHDCPICDAALNLGGGAASAIAKHSSTVDTPLPGRRLWGAPK